MFDILKQKKGSIRQAQLPKGLPSWDEFNQMIWEQIEAGAGVNKPGFRVVRKLLTDKKMNNNVFDKFTVFLDALERRGIGYSLAHHREEAMMIIVAVPGERWEIEFLSDGSVEVERFISNGEICQRPLANASGLW